jgi:cell division protein FtsI (penicillin-binding protein 3)
LNMFSRLRLYSALFILAFVLLTYRLFYWQIIKGKELSSSARGQYEKGFELSAGRGEILAADGSWLSASVRSWLVYAEPPKLEEDPTKIADKLAAFFVDDNNDRQAIIAEIARLDKLLRSENLVWVPLKQRIPSDVKESLEKLVISGIGFQEEEMRAYPEASSSAHILGFVGKDEDGDDKGYFGLEGFYDLILSGKPGFVSRESDARGIPILLVDSREIGAVRGVSLKTHIDKTVQLTLDKKLALGLEEYGAVSGLGVVMDPKSGAILGMSAYPSYDPEKYFDYTNELFLNPVVSQSFEPGSIFKVLVMAAGIDAGAVDSDTKCEICSGPVKIGKYSIETWDGKYYPDSSMLDVIVHSDNVGMTFVTSKLGEEKFYDYLTNFGFGQKTGIDLQGESSPKLRDKGMWSEIDLATASFGQGIAVTPIQMVTAVAAIANKGNLMTPQVVDKLVTEGWSDDISVEAKRRVISEKTAGQITAMMVEAAKNGEAKWTHARGYGVAGKTGTAQIPILGHYDEEKTIASFVGFAPYDDPKFVMLITLREPSSSPWASETAAPLWYEIAKELFYYYGLQPEN